jgi:hypothetical protein
MMGEEGERERVQLLTSMDRGLAFIKVSGLFIKRDRLKLC